MLIVIPGTKFKTWISFSLQNILFFALGVFFTILSTRSVVNFKDVFIDIPEKSLNDFFVIFFIGYMLGVCASPLILNVYGEKRVLIGAVVPNFSVIFLIVFPRIVTLNVIGVLMGATLAVQYMAIGVHMSNLCEREMYPSAIYVGVGVVTINLAMLPGDIIRFFKNDFHPSLFGKCMFVAVIYTTSCLAIVCFIYIRKFEEYPGNCDSKILMRNEFLRCFYNIAKTLINLEVVLLIPMLIFCGQCFSWSACSYGVDIMLGITNILQDSGALSSLSSTIGTFAAATLITAISHNSGGTLSRCSLLTSGVALQVACFSFLLLYLPIKTQHPAQYNDELLIRLHPAIIISSLMHGASLSCFMLHLYVTIFERFSQSINYVFFLTKFLETMTFLITSSYFQPFEIQRQYGSLIISGVMAILIFYIYLHFTAVKYDFGCKSSEESLSGPYVYNRYS